MRHSDPSFIHSKIPHRPPMLLIDEVTELSESAIRCRKTFRGDEFFLQGHYPGQPIVPGLILCECAAQAGAILAASTANSARSGVPMLTRVNDVRFKQVVRPGDCITVDVRREEQLGNATYFAASIKLGERIAATLTFAAMVSGGE